MVLRKRLFKKRRPARKGMRKGKGRVRRAPSHGHLRLKRKMPEIHLYSSAPAGAAGFMGVSDPTGTCFTVGTATNVPGVSGLFNIPFSMVFRLDQLPTYTEISNLADRYKLNSIVAKIRCNQNVQSVNQTTPNPSLPWIEWIADHDDGALQTAALFRERMGVTTRYFGASSKPVVMSCKPRTANVVFNNGVTTAYSVPNKSQWINSSYTGIEHYAIKGILHEVSLPGTIYAGSSFSVDVTFDVSAADFQ